MSDAASPNAPSAVPEDQAAREWLANVYQGDDARQLSVRSIVTGMLIGGVMSISNLYVGLFTGWGLGVTITSCIIAYAVFKALEAIVPGYRENHFTMLENYTMSSAASAAGMMSSAGLVSALPALLLLTGEQLPWWQIMCWMGAVSLLGVFMAIPLKRQLINVEQLPFPSGIATAETLRSMHTSGAEAMQKAKALFWTGLFGAGLGFWRKGFTAIAEGLRSRPEVASLADGVESCALPDEFPLYPGGEDLMKKLTVGWSSSLIMVAAGAIMGIRVGASLLLGACVYFVILGPRLIDAGIVVPGASLKDLTVGQVRSVIHWALWPATAMMVASGLLSFGLRWRIIVRAIGGLGTALFKKEQNQDPLARIEVPGSWFLGGTLLAGTACIVCGHFFFQISWWMGLVAVLLTFLLSVVAARATGETDITPVGAMGKITQLTYGVVAPSNTTTNLMTACITAGAASHSADLLSDLKSGYLLGGNPRKQTISQLFGVLAGTLVCVPVYLAIVTYAKLMPGEGGKAAEIPAVAAQVWKSVAELLAKGPQALPRYAVLAMAIAGALGVVITLLEEFLPKERRKWIPSATGLGIAGVIGAYDAQAMFIGALVAWAFAKARPAAAEKYTIAVSSGLIAGQSLMEAGIAVTTAMIDIINNLRQKL